MAVFKYDENNRRHRFIRTIVVTVVSLAVFLVLWWVATVLMNDQNFPTPDKVFAALYDLILNGDPIGGHSIWEYIAISLKTFLYGFGLALVVADPLGLLLGYVKPLREFTAPWIEVVRPIAPIAWAPIFVLSFGSRLGPALVVFIGIFFPLLTNIIFGVQRIDKNWLDASKTLGASQGQLFYKVVLPATVPYILNGVKVGLGVGWMCIVAAEIYNKFGGIGQYLVDMVNGGLMANAFAAIIIIAILGLLTTGVAEYVSKLVSRRMGMDA
ncbi:MAG: ABC transporter permease [Candidatus Methanomethylophilaceae archaeon]|nr:ABC transporter permease [Candidatus Methanomethylophilaceae archaeon]